MFRTLAFAILICLSTVPSHAKCTGTANCMECTSCEICRYCTRQGGTCGVCSRTRKLPVAPSKPAWPSKGTSRALEPRVVTQPNKPVITRPAKPVTLLRPVTTLSVPKSFTAKCVSVHDGDTMSVAYNGGTVRVRLYAIDAPELGQPFGTLAKINLAEVAVGRSVKVYSVSSDTYGRLLAWVFIGGACLNKELVREGNAWHYKKYSPRETILTGLEASARLAKKGLWEQSKPVPPWDWRKTRR